MVTQHTQDNATLRSFNALLQDSVAPAFSYMTIANTSQSTLHDFVRSRKLEAISENKTEFFP